MANARGALWDAGHDESVEVNQRALIDKVLARYSGEFTVFRELLQNSDDAGAHAVEIHFETKEYINQKSGQTDSEPVVDQRAALDLKAALVHQWTFKNNGMVFRDEDWNRLKKIAEGNPDEEKIGAFGVGFYSLFSVTEEPFVTSGGQWMGFYWKDKKDQLFARRGRLPDTSNDGWTTFEMFLREPAPIPRAFDITRFLASSITFMSHLSEVSIYLDERRISRLSKVIGASKPITIPRGLKTSSPKGIMQVKEIHTTPLSIRAEVLLWVYMAGSEESRSLKASSKSALTNGPTTFFSSLFSSFTSGSSSQRTATPAPEQSVVEPDPTTTIESNVKLSIYAAGIGVKLDQKLKADLNRATKKNPPTSLRIELIYTGKDEYDASKEEDEEQPEITGSVFQGLRADLDGAGAARIFIGHATGQTTGLAGHIAARFIPTVERESIDLMDRTVAVWNEELLYAGGFLARSAYEMEMDTIRSLWVSAAEGPATKDLSSDEALRTWLQGRAVHGLKFFTFHPSTPSAVVSAKLEDAFFSCASNKQFAIISTSGVKNATEVRIPDALFADFLKVLPVLPEEVLKNARPMVDVLCSRGIIRSIEFMDVLQELRSRPLTENEMLACFKWWIGIQDQHDAQSLERIRTELLNAAVLFIGEGEGSGGKITPISSIQTFLDLRGAGAIIPVDGPLPAHLLPVSISKHFSAKQLSLAFPWKELVILNWLEYIVGLSATASSDVEHDVTKSAHWAERVLQVLARAWPSLAKDTQDRAIELIRDKACVPTSAGLKLPMEAYFQNAHIFHDLPVVQFPSSAHVKGSLEKLLQSLGVRKHVDLQIVFDRMIKTGDWTTAELVKYLVAVQSMLTPMEHDRLRMTAAFAKEGESSSGSEKKIVRFKARDLYEPLDVFRDLRLPLIDWGNHPKWRGNSEEAKFLFDLGLRRFPPLSVIVRLAANEDRAVNQAALRYLLDNIITKYTDYDPRAFADFPFVPAIKGEIACLAKPLEVFASFCWAQLGFTVVESSLRMEALMKLRIDEHPPTSALVNLLQSSPPTTESTAREWFSILSSRVTDFFPSQLKVLSQMPFIPVPNFENGTTRMLPPSQCYFRGASDANFHSRLFVFVDFGAQGNQFLSVCGTKHEPSVEEIAGILLQDPHRFYELAGGRENYLIELRNIAVNHRLIPSSTLLRLKRSAALVGSMRVKKVKSAEKAQAADGSAELEEDDWDYQYDLLPPEQIVVADDMHAYQLFGDSIFAAPQEDILEVFYMKLGSKPLSSLIREEYRTTAEIKGSRKAVEIRSLILERLPLFLHEHTHGRRRESYGELSNEKNFIVRTFGKLTVMKSLQFGKTRSVKTQDSSAIARREGRGPIELWLAGNDHVDLYEVATSMCRFIFDSPKPNDALLFMTILSTDLKALKRRGYNVDRILRQQKAQRETSLNSLKEKQNTTELASQTTGLAQAPLSGGGTQSQIHSASERERTEQLLQRQSMAADSQSSLGDAQEQLNANWAAMPDTAKRASTAQSAFRQSLTTWARRLNGRTEPSGISGSEYPSGSNSPASISRPSSPVSTGALSSGTSYVGQRENQPDVVPKATIATMINSAISACRQEKSKELQGKERMEMIREEANKTYCDGAVKITLIGEMGNIKVFASPDVPDAKSIMTTKSQSIARFIYVIRPLCEVYNLPDASVNIYYDLAGHRIAFNRNSSLFLNLRYFEAWHDEAVNKGELTEAYFSWFLTLAHEIAHNLIGPHNSAHEFYFSAISEAHLPALLNFLRDGHDT
ncbi:uncharacterized protein LAESUDRAFT_720694 [Laetiporus sulphureus 93-53]|uniref:Sacsin/Nov domain-containing protein n=1 Tax=Laetiporus sulphureus 93-53 TaxID=1314785 RepID=A0A165HA96_9APHY|nr:uncharacterized protein LAESUDRAFT_720694 [Laetiporus sulphureus 93-53]KZT11459.1 hypothetical protein LAESUDRAFT_720694 [Laetiporus sulphureus 93-53]